MRFALRFGIPIIVAAVVGIAVRVAVISQIPNLPESSALIASAAAAAAAVVVVMHVRRQHR